MIMLNKISSFVFLCSFVLLQSCSGGRIGDFLESSFKNDNYSNQKYQKENTLKETEKEKNLPANKFKDDEKIKNEEKSIEMIGPNIRNNNSQSKNNFSDIKNKSMNKKSIIKNKDFNPKSYRVYVILNKVDPSFPTENFSRVLRNANINFEIEKIELVPNLIPQSKINQKNFKN